MKGLSLHAENVFVHDDCGGKAPLLPLMHENPDSETFSTERDDPNQSNAERATACRMDEDHTLYTAPSDSDDEDDPEQQEVSQQLWAELANHMKNHQTRAEPTKESRESAENVARERLQQLRSHRSNTQLTGNKYTQDQPAEPAHIDRSLREQKQYLTHQEKGAAEGSTKASVQIGTPPRKRRCRRGATAKNATPKSP